MKNLKKYEELILERLSPKLKWDELTSILHKKLGFNITDLIYDVATELEDEEMKTFFFVYVQNKNKPGFTGVLSYHKDKDVNNHQNSSWVNYDKNISFLDIYKSSYRDDIRNMNFDTIISISVQSEKVDKEVFFDVIDKYCELYNLRIHNDPRIGDFYHTDRFITLDLSK